MKTNLKKSQREFKGTVTRVIDGDTVKLSVRLVRSRGKNLDLGFHVYKEQGWFVLHYTFRLLGCNAREQGTPGGAAATANLKTLLPIGTLVSITSVANDKYGRYDAALTLPDKTDLIGKLIAEQWAAAWNGRGEAPMPPWPRTI